MAYRKFLDHSKLFFTSDTHFGHENILKYCGRPYRSIDGMREQFIYLWNKKVPADGIVFHCGDFAFAEKDEVADILNRLNGTVILIEGNHDNESKNPDRAWLHLFEEVHSLLRIHVMDHHQSITLCHYPMLVWDRSANGSWMLHGHCHGTLIDAPGLCLDVGIDCNPHYEPFSFLEIKKIMKSKEVSVQDGHGTGRNYGSPRKHKV